MKCLALVAAVGLCIAVATSTLAQSYMATTSNIAMTGIANTAAMNSVLRNTYGNGRPQSRGSRGLAFANQPSGGIARSGRVGGFGAAGGASADVASASFTYRPTRAESDAALGAFIDRLRQKNPSAAETAASELRRHDISKIYRGIVAPFGLGDGDIGDQLTAYTVLGYMIATGDDDPDRASISAARRQIVERLASNPRVASADTRAALGEELKILFVTLHAGWQSARKEGNLAQYSAGVAQMFQRMGDADLRQVRLTPAGFVAR